MRNLLGRLLDRSPGELERIAVFWDVTLAGRDRYDDVAAIYRTMTDIWAVRDAWEQLSPAGRLLILKLHEQGTNAASPERLSEELGLNAEETRAELRQLYSYGIVSIDSRDDLALMPDDVELFTPREISLVFHRVHQERTEPYDRPLPLDELLATLPFPEIEEAASTWGARVTPGVHARGELVNIIRKQLEDPERTRQFVASLSGQARQLWQRLRDAGGELPLDEVLSPVDVSYSRRRQIIEELAGPLLVWHQWREAEEGWRRLLVIPEGILHPAVPEPAPVPELLAVDEADVEEAEWIFPVSCAWDLLTILREAASSNPRWASLLEADPRLVRRFEHRLWRSTRETGSIPTGYLPFLVRVGALIGVLRDEGNLAIPGPEAALWRRSAFTTAGQKMVAAWTAAESWIEGQDRVELTLYGASWPAFRATLLRNFGELAPDTWYDEERFIDHLLIGEPDLLRQAQVGSVISSQLPMQITPARPVGDRRAQVISLIIGTTLETAAVWLNLIQRSHDRERGKPVFKLTAFGQWIAARRPEPQLPQLGPAPLAVGANFQVLLYRPTPRRVWALSSFAELNSLDRVSTYTITATTLIRSLASGVNLSDITSFLTSQSGAEIPQNVGYTLVEWDRGYRRVWLRNAVLLLPEEGEDSGKIAGVLRDAGLEPEILPDGRLLLIYDDPGAGERLFTAANRALRDHGFAPLAEPEPLRRPS